MEYDARKAQVNIQLDQIWGTRSSLDTSSQECTASQSHLHDPQTAKSMSKLPHTHIQVGNVVLASIPIQSGLSFYPFISRESSGTPLKISAGASSILPVYSFVFEKEIESKTELKSAKKNVKIS